MNPVGVAISPTATRIIGTITALLTLRSFCLSQLAGYMYLRPAALTLKVVHAFRRYLEFLLSCWPVSRRRWLRFSVPSCNLPHHSIVLQ